MTFFPVNFTVENVMSRKKSNKHSYSFLNQEEKTQRKEIKMTKYEHDILFIKVYLYKHTNICTYKDKRDC